MDIDGCGCGKENGAGLEPFKTVNTRDAFAFIACVLYVMLSAAKNNMFDSKDIEKGR
jgi:hypothetical protein